MKSASLLNIYVGFLFNENLKNGSSKEWTLRESEFVLAAYFFIVSEKKFLKIGILKAKVYTKKVPNIE